LSLRNRPSEQQRWKYTTLKPRRARPGSWRAPVDDDYWVPPNRMRGMGNAEPMRPRSRMDGNLYEDPSLGGRGYHDDSGQLYEYEDVSRNNMQSPDGSDETVESLQSQEQQAEVVPSSTLQSTTVAG
jgi:hypothetical protein